MQVAPLDERQHAACILWGATTLVVSLILKLTPEAWTKKIPIRVNEDDDSSDAIVSLYNSQAKAKFITNDGTTTTVRPEPTPLD